MPVHSLATKQCKTDTSTARNFNERTAVATATSLQLFGKTFLRRTCTLLASILIAPLFWYTKFSSHLAIHYFLFSQWFPTIPFKYIFCSYNTEIEHSSLKNYSHQKTIPMMSTNESIYEKSSNRATYFALRCARFLSLADLIRVKCFCIYGDFHQSFCCRFNYVLN